jgi:hypothetical protein
MPVNSRRDDIDSWLDTDVEPLAPPPGTFERVSRQARRRKTSRAVMSAAGAAVIVAGLAASPRIAGDLLHHPVGRAVASRAVPRTSAPATPGPTPSGGSGTPAAKTATPAPTAGTPLGLAPPAGADPVPANFRPTSVTFVGANTGAVIGQAGTPGNCAGPVPADCTSLAGTSNYGRTWYGVSAPVTGAPHGTAGVSALRFLNVSKGWAFGPELWVTHDGGAHWNRVPTHGLRVTSLETAGNRAFAVFARCTGGGADFASHCASFRLFSSAVTGGTWRPVPGAAGDLTLATGAAGQAASPSLVLTAGPPSHLAAGTGYLLAPSGAVLSGSLAGGSWTMAGQAPCRPAVLPAGGLAASAVLAAGSNELFLACTGAPSPAGQYVKTIWASASGGKHWLRVGRVHGPGVATSLAAAQGGLVVLATTTCIDISTDGGASWRQTYPPGAAAGHLGFSYVGMTDQQQGVAVPADPGLHEIFITGNGGRTWQPSPIRS